MSTTICRGLRGATTVQKDEKEDILEATQELLQELLDLNTIEPQSIASIFFTTSPDLKSVFPAEAARAMSDDLKDVPLFCAQEIDVSGALKKCIRILLHWNTTKIQSEVRHVYLREAKKLRPDLLS